MKRKIISFLMLGAAASIMFPVSVYADTPTAEYVEEKRVEVELRKKEYLEALEKENAARDILVNAERTLDDAQEKYDYAMEQYKTGVRGFLEWVIETETDPARIEDAKNAVKLMETYMNRQSDEFYPDDAYSNLGEKESATNITRINYLANWLDEFEKYNDKVSLFTSHVNLITHIDYVISIERGYDYVWPGEVFLTWPYIEAIFPLGTYISYNSSDMPELSFKGNELPSEYLLVNTEDIPKQGSLAIALGTTAENENLLTWAIKDLDIQDNIQYYESLLPENEFLTSKYAFYTSNNDFMNYRNATYTLSEYAQAIRDYYALVDPVGAITLLNSKSDDFSNAQQEYDFSAQNTINCLSTLRGAEKEYEEAVALFEDWQAQQVVEDLPVETNESPFIEVLSEENEPQLNNNTVDTDTESDVAYQAESEVLSSTPIVTEVISTGEVTEYQDSSKETRVEAPDSKNDGLLAQVLSYIFNGGAIALILPAGLFRKKEIIV